MFPKSISEIPAQWQVNSPIEQTEYLVDGEIRHWEGARNEVYSPICLADGQEYQRIYLGSTPLLSAEVATELLDAAVRSYDLGRGVWPSMSVSERIGCVEQFIASMKAQRQEVVKYLMWEIGKTLKDAEKEFDRTIDYIVDTIEDLKNLDRSAARFEVEEGILAQIRRVPLGVTLVMGPFNYPLNETFTTLIPAIIMGNTAILKPARYGVLLVRPLLEAFRDCFPKGVVNVLYGDGQTTISPLIQSGKIDVFSFIGTSKTANIITTQHPKPNRLRTVLGLDAKNAGIVLPDANLSEAVAECLNGTLSFNGQRCTALKMLWVHQSIADAFIEQFVEGLNQFKPGLPWEEGVRLTPLPEKNKTEYLSEYVQDALQKGATIVNAGGGEAIGTYFQPAVIKGITQDMRLWHEEQFGPIIPIALYDDVKEAIQYVVDANFGQQASVFGTDSTQIAQVVDALVHQVGRVNINAQSQRGPDVFPFTGRKDSAEGTLSVRDALRAFSIRTIVATKESNKGMIKQILHDRSSKFLSDDYLF